MTTEKTPPEQNVNPFLYIRDLDETDPNALDFKTLKDAEVFIEQIYARLGQMLSDDFCQIREVQTLTDGQGQFLVVWIAPIAHLVVRVYQAKMIESYTKAILESIMRGSFEEPEDTERYLTQDESISICYQILVKGVLPLGTGRAVSQEDYGKRTGDVFGSEFKFVRHGICDLAQMSTALTEEAFVWGNEQKEIGAIREANKKATATFVDSIPEIRCKNLPIVKDNHAVVWYCWIEDATKRLVTVSPEYTGRYIDSETIRETVSVDTLSLLPDDLPKEREALKLALANYEITDTALNALCSLLNEEDDLVEDDFMPDDEYTERDEELDCADDCGLEREEDEDSGDDIPGSGDTDTGRGS